MAGIWLLRLLVLLLAIGSIGAQNRVIPIRLINQLMGYTTTNPAYYLHSGGVIGTGQATRCIYWCGYNEYVHPDSLTGRSVVWEFRLGADQWIALDRLEGFPAGARRLSSVTGGGSVPLFVSQPADRLEPRPYPLFLWGWSSAYQQDSVEWTVAPLFAFTPKERIPQYLPSYKPWRMIGLQIPPTVPTGAQYYAGDIINGVQLPGSDSVCFAINTQYPADRNTPGDGHLYMCWYVGVPIDDTLALRTWIKVNSDADEPSDRLPILISNIVVGPDSAVYALHCYPFMFPLPKSTETSPLKIRKYSPRTNELISVTPTSGITTIFKSGGIPFGYLWTHDSCIYILGRITRPIQSITHVLRYNVYTGRCDSVLTLTTDGNNDVIPYALLEWDQKLITKTTLYQGGIATVGIDYNPPEPDKDTLYTTIFILSHQPDGSLTVKRIRVKDIFPMIRHPRSELTHSLTSDGTRLFLATTDNLYIIDPTSSTVEQPAAPDPSVYPNPVPRGQTVTLTLPTSESVTDVHVYDLAGKSLQLPVHQHQATLTFSTSTLAGGVYWVVVKTEDGRFWVRSVTVQ